jgi:hypothetical protein
MAHSIQILGQKTAILPDEDLIIVICIMNLVTSDADKYKVLSPYIERWRHNLTGYAPGCINLNLEVLSACNEGLTELSTALTAVEQRIGAYGETIPGRVLNDLCQIEGIYFADYPANSVLRGIEAIRKLLAPTEMKR